MDRPAWNVLTGTLTRYALLFVNVALGIFLMPFTMGHLGKAEYGLWMLAASMTAYLQLLDLGYGNGLVRQLTQADARGDEDDMNVVLSTFVVVYALIGIAALAALVPLTGLLLPRFPNLSPEQVRTGQWVLLILGLRVAVAFPMSVFGAVNTARQRFAVTGTISIVVALAQATATVLVLQAGYGLIPLVAATTTIGLTSYIAYAIVARRTFPAMRLSVRRFSRPQVREVTSYSLYLFLISIAIHLGASLDTLIIGAYLGTSAIAVYTVAVRLAEYQRQLCGQFSGFLFPLVVRFDARRDLEALRATLLDGTRIALGLVVGVTICLVTFGADLVTLWMGPGFASSIAPLGVLALAGVLMVAQGPAGTILLSTGSHRLVAGLSLLELAGNALLSVALVSRFGLLGVALGTAIPYVLLNAAVLMPRACRAVGVPLGQFIRTVARPAALAAVPATAVAAALRAGTSPQSLLAVVGLGAVVGAVYVVAFVGFGLPATDRARYLGSMRRPGIGWEARELRRHDAQRTAM
ncbi:MAG TPA: oligosaccharide flippase family protein [Vicinamibacterales bacterium]|nr:oligosaccharide flippase family protein [Vicinamibacterales bacterium]